MKEMVVDFRKNPDVISPVTINNQPVEMLTNTGILAPWSRTISCLSHRLMLWERKLIGDIFFLIASSEILMLITLLWKCFILVLWNLCLPSPLCYTDSYTANQLVSGKEKEEATASGSSSAVTKTGSYTKLANTGGCSINTALDISRSEQHNLLKWSAKNSTDGLALLMLGSGKRDMEVCLNSMLFE